MDTSKLVPNDDRVRRGSATVRGRRYEYVVGEPQGSPPVGTVFLIHGFPDLGFGWRCQVPYLVSLGFRVVVPDMLGYAGSDSPRDLRDYSLKSQSADIKELARIFVGDGQIILGGHDWGGFLVWRVPMWHPGLVKAVFSVCTPFLAPSPTYVPLEDLIAAGKLTHFTYQLQFMGPDVENAIQGEEKVRQFLNAVHGGAGPNGEAGMNISKGVLFENLPKLRHTTQLSEEELDHYVQQYMRQAAPQLRGPLNWYRMRKINWEEDLPLADKAATLDIPSLFIAATDDVALPPHLSKNMERYVTKLTRGEVKATHWALTEASADVNRLLGEWLNGVMGRAIKSAL